MYFYPRPPRGGRPAELVLTAPCRNHFYPRPPRGGRLETALCELDAALFLSTPSARRATDRATCVRLYQEISIHALREEGDEHEGMSKWPKRYFYPRPPRGGRPVAADKVAHVFIISIHALREEGDTNFFRLVAVMFQFLSTPSARRATTAVSFPASCRDNFYPRPPRGGRLLSLEQYPIVSVISIHALREEGDSASSMT